MPSVRDVHPHYDVLSDVLRTEQARKFALDAIAREDARYAAWNADVDPMGPNRAVIAKARRDAEKRLVAAVSAFQAAVTAAVLKGASGSMIRNAINGIVPVSAWAPGEGSWDDADSEIPGL